MNLSLIRHLRDTFPQGGRLTDCSLRFYYIIEKIAQAGKKLGLDYKTALELSAQTALGSAKMMFKTPDTPEELIRAVTTPGGCTEVGNNVLNNSNIDEILFKTIKRTIL